MDQRFSVCRRPWNSGLQIILTRWTLGEDKRHLIIKGSGWIADNRHRQNAADERTECARVGLGYSLEIGLPTYRIKRAKNGLLQVNLRIGAACLATPKFLMAFGEFSHYRPTNGWICARLCH